jgi:hypothetical protein
MKKEDLIEGEIYYYNMLGEYDTIVRYGKNKHYRINIHVGYNHWDRVDTYDFDTGLIRKATHEETQWFEACEKAGKFIPRDEVNISSQVIYEIY